MSDAPLASRRVPLVEVLDRVIDKGAVVSADALLGLADVDLIRVALRLVIAPADRATGAAAPLPSRPTDPVDVSGRTPRLRVTSPSPGPMPVATRPDGTERADRQGLDRGLVQLVLTVVELLRELMDRQAVRRAMRGTLTDEQAERLGVALIELDERMDELVASFGLDRRDLNLDLGPLGDLL